MPRFHSALLFSLSVFCFAASAAFVSAETVRWNNSLSFDGGGLWTIRVPLVIENKRNTPLEGLPVKVQLPETAKPPLVNEIRITKEDGQEVVFSAFSAKGEPLFDGELAKGSYLMIPADCEVGKKAAYFLYYGNEKAERVPDYFEAGGTFTNGDFEGGSGTIPQNWIADPDDAEHQNLWVDENPKSGKKCIKTVIKDGEEPSWFAVRQINIPVSPNGKYKFSAWVRGENIKGRAGWFLHCGNDKNSQAINKTEGNFTGTFDWKEIVINFTAPADADRAAVGTLLYGTGTAWFDKVSFERLDKEDELKFTAGEPEIIPYKVYEPEKDFPLVADNDYLCRSTFRIVNDSEKPLENAAVLMTLRGALAHGLTGIMKDAVLIMGSGTDTKKIPVNVLDPHNHRLSVKISVPAKAVQYFNVYYKFDEESSNAESNNTGTKKNDVNTGTAHPELQRTEDPFADLPNLLKNSGFEEIEEGSTYPSMWQRNDNNPPKGVKYSLESSPEIVRFGKRCARLDVDKDVPVSWRGWTQRVPVEAGNSYFVQGWLKTKDTASVRIHIHFLEADGKNCEMSSINQDISGTADWTRIAEVMKAPYTAKFMVVHLTTNSSGTVWHDNISVFNGLFAEQTGRESFQNIPKDKDALAVWQVPAVIKVFPQTIPGLTLKNERKHFYIEAAGNEKEPLQLAFRTTGKYSLNNPLSLKIKVDVPKNSSGFKLDKFEINTVGYVPVDYPSSYYNLKTPKWYRKVPASAPGCDGWTGLFPDPLLDSDTVALQNNRTESVWLTWSIPKNAPAGIYTGNVSLVNDENKTVYSKPLTVKVHNFVLPDENHISAIYDVRLGPGGKVWGKSIADWYPEIVSLMAENRLSPDTVGIVPKIEQKDGKFVFDWAEFDKRCNWYFNEKKIRTSYTPWSFYVFGWGHPPKKLYGEEPYPGEWPFKDADFSKLRPEYKKVYQDLLRQFWNHIKEKNWDKHFVLYISDEPNFWSNNIVEQMKAVCEMIHEVDKNIPVYCSTWHYVPQWKDSLNIWGIGHYGIVLPEVMKEIKDCGSRIWFTTDGMLCLDTPYNAIERLLPHYCHKYGADAYEFWGVAWTTYDPYQYGSHAYIWQTSTPGEYYWVRYPNGDGYLLYPPHNDIPKDGKKVGKVVQTIRFGQAREGVEDYEYLYILEHLIAEAKQKGKNTASAEAALQKAGELVTCPTATGRYSSQILPNPLQLYEIRHKVAEAIELLNKK